MAIAPLQIPGYAAPLSVDLSTPLANLGQVYQKAQQDALRRDTLAQLGAGSGQVDPRGLLASGDMSLAQLGLQIQNQNTASARDARDFAFRQEESARAQRNADRSYGLQARAAARADEDKYAIKEVTNPDGTTTLVRINQRGPEGVIDTGVAPAAADSGNPFGSGKFNSEQGKAAGFADRMLQSEGILSGTAPATGIGPTSGGADLEGTSLTARGMSRVPVVGNFAVGQNYQKYDQAKRDFINAQLRRESGAAIAPSEFENADRQYFPVPGDSPQVIEQKRANRRAAISAMGREGGPSYRPQYDFNGSGQVRPRKIAPAQSAEGGASGPISKAQYDALPSGALFTAPDGTQRVKP